jgi:hypothetical protein
MHVCVLHSTGQRSAVDRRAAHLPHALQRHATAAAGLRVRRREEHGHSVALCSECDRAPEGLCDGRRTHEVLRLLDRWPRRVKWV